nr:topoisomerase C-terminal repeat-containing protein [Saprospiraceae bacterium]
YGPVVQIGDQEELKEDQKPRFANLRKGQSMESITYDEAMELFQLPKSFGEYKGEELIINNGRFGAYVKLGETYANLAKGVDPMEVSREQAETIIDAKLKENEPITTYKSLPVTKGKGRFGPFVKWGDLFVNIPAKLSIDTLSEKQAIELIEAKIDKEANRYIQHWPEEQISIENGRWGPYVKYKKSNVKIPKVDGNKLTDDNLRNIPLEVVKGWIESELPGSFSEKKDVKKAVKKPAKKITKK